MNNVLDPFKEIRETYGILLDEVEPLVNFFIKKAHMNRSEAWQTAIQMKQFEATRELTEAIKSNKS